MSGTCDADVTGALPSLELRAPTLDAVVFGVTSVTLIDKEAGPASSEFGPERVDSGDSPGQKRISDIGGRRGPQERLVGRLERITPRFLPCRPARRGGRRRSRCCGDSDLATATRAAFNRVHPLHEIDA